MNEFSVSHRMRLVNTTLDSLTHRRSSDLISFCEIKVVNIKQTPKPKRNTESIEPSLY